MKQLHEHALVFSINNAYTFALANVLMSLREHSRAVFDASDILVYTDDIAAQNKDILRRLCPAIQFLPLEREEYAPLYRHPHTSFWTKNILAKLYCFELIQHYRKVLSLDSDIYIYNDISNLLKYQEEMAWRSIKWLRYDMSPLLRHPQDRPPAPNGGVILFTEKLAARAIGTKEILDAYATVKNQGRIGIDERILSYLAYQYTLSVAEIPPAYHAYPLEPDVSHARLVHFVSALKPWKSRAIMAAFPEWGKNHASFLRMGGETPPALTVPEYDRAYIAMTLLDGERFARLRQGMRKLKARLKAAIIRENSPLEHGLDSLHTFLSNLKKTLIHASPLLKRLLR